MDYDEAIEYLFNLKIYGMSLGLERIEFLLKTLGDPQKNMKAVHVAGTNGKGSVCAMLSSILVSAGYKVGLFTSPHLLSFEERILVDQNKISKDKVIQLAERIKSISESMVKSGKFDHPTFFETACAMAFEHFKEEKVDIAILEVGLGGRLDATNVVYPTASVITTIALDHTHVLGKTFKEVAREKAGIIKNNVPVVTGIEDDDILNIIKKICEEKKAQIYSHKEQGNIISNESSLDGQIFEIELKDRRYKDLKIPLLGEYQLKNALVCVLTLEVLKKKGMDIPEESVKRGFETTRWPARMEIVQKEPTIVLDCAHNPAGMRALVSTLTDLFSKRPLTFVIGIMRDKDIPGIIKEVAPKAHCIIVTKPKFERAALPERIESEAKKYLSDVVVIENVAEAVSQAIKKAEKNGIICISGSIFNVSEAMATLNIEGH
ncbi:MAG: bifunctional folylpolyglutamate synthase/dihydrofolate synthase [Thermoplasmata archaeon]|nr:MAG: bifunctional folylpolyglutamate synthase/dihydrofolate synthase [Thermoplasmata archaeon]